MALEIVGELIGPILRLVARVIAEFFLQGFLYYTGRLVLWPFYGRRKEPSEWLCLVVGTLTWLTVGLAGWIAYSQFR